MNFSPLSKCFGCLICSLILTACSFSHPPPSNWSPPNKNLGESVCPQISGKFQDIGHGTACDLEDDQHCRLSRKFFSWNDPVFTADERKVGMVTYFDECPTQVEIDKEGDEYIIIATAACNNDVYRSKTALSRSAGDFTCEPEGLVIVDWDWLFFGFAANLVKNTFTIRQLADESLIAKWEVGGGGWYWIFPVGGSGEQWITWTAVQD